MKNGYTADLAGGESDDGMFCIGEIQGTFAKKYKNCEVCDFLPDGEKGRVPLVRAFGNTSCKAEELISAGSRQVHFSGGRRV
jgi:hypothetical protein